MSNQLILSDRVRNFFTSDARSLYRIFDQSQKESYSIKARKISVSGSAVPRFQRFSHFIPEHMMHAREVYSHFMTLADSVEGKQGVEKVLAEVNSLAEIYHPDLLFYAMMVFLTHHPKGQGISIPSLEERSPYLLSPSQAGIKSRETSSAADETTLNWYRENPLMAEHHEHWHVVFPTAGLIDEYGTPRLRDRHGELFFYM